MWITFMILTNRYLFLLSSLIREPTKCLKDSQKNNKRNLKDILRKHEAKNHTEKGQFCKTSDTLDINNSDLTPKGLLYYTHLLQTLHYKFIE